VVLARSWRGREAPGRVVARANVWAIHPPRIVPAWHCGGERVVRDRWIILGSRVEWHETARTLTLPGPWAGHRSDRTRSGRPCVAAALHDSQSSSPANHPCSATWQQRRKAVTSVFSFTHHSSVALRYTGHHKCQCQGDVTVSAKVRGAVLPSARDRACGSAVLWRLSDDR